MHDNLPDVRLTPTVVQRVQGRLLGLFGGVTAKGLNYSIPSVLRGAWVPKPMGSLGGTEKRRLKQIKRRKKEIKRLLKRKSLGLPINPKDTKILNNRRSWIYEDIENPDVREQDLFSVEPIPPKIGSKRVREPEGYIPVRIHKKKESQMLKLT